MNKLLMLVSFIVFTMGCNVSGKEDAALFHAYSKYKNTTNENFIKKSARIYFSKRLLGEHYLSNPDAANQLLFKNYMAATASHFESIKPIKSCLTINGYDDENAPLIFSLKYILMDGNWLIDKIHVVFIDSIKDFGSEAKCPGSFINQ